MTNPGDFLEGLFRTAVDAAQPAVCVPPYLPEPPAGRTVVVGAGKAAAAMARVVETRWPGERPLSGLVITRYGHGVPCERIDVVEAGHPLPDAAGQEAAQRVLECVQGLSRRDLVLCLLSGGGSALLTVPASGITLDDKRQVTQALLTSGANIAEINCVRKHISAVKGGRLAVAAQPARVRALAISDVAGDDPSVIASGPTVADPTTFTEARAVLAKYGIEPAPRVAVYLQEACDETPKPGDARLAGSSFWTIVDAQDALQAAAEAARAMGIKALIVGNDLEGEAARLGEAQAGMALHAAIAGEPITGPAVLLSGGETTVTVKGNGRGGRNTEYLLGLALALNEAAGIYALAADTDGIDGTENNAGAIIGPGTLARARALGLDGLALLQSNDAYSFFAALGDLVFTGPTHTNVNDFRAILIGA